MKKIFSAILIISMVFCFASCRKEHVHTGELVTSKNATCTENGNILHYRCTGCDKVFSDRDCTVELVPETVIIEAHHDFSEATCTMAMMCSRCLLISGTPKGHAFLRSEWRYKTEEGHGHTCYCGEVETVFPHSSATGATETEPEVCVDCGFVIAPPLGEVDMPD